MGIYSTIVFEGGYARILIEVNKRINKKTMILENIPAKVDWEYRLTDDGRQLGQVEELRKNNE